MVTITNPVTEIIYLNGEIAPMQEDISPAMDSLPPFQKNLSYYSSTGSLYNLTHYLSEPYIVFGEQGVALSILPFTYNPQMGALTVTTAMRIIIDYNALGQTPSDELLTQVDVIVDFLSDHFLNYEKPFPISMAALPTGLYLVRLIDESEQIIQQQIILKN